MKYRTLGKTGEQVSALGYGCMRFPVIDGDNTNIDEKRAISLIREAIDSGINYIDTAYPYHGGNSELVVGKALADGYRERIKLATKLPSWFISKRDDMDKYLNQQLERLKTDHIDFYLLHALSKSRWDNYVKNDVFDFIESALKDGRIKHIGFSFHDELEVFKEIVDSYNWDFCLMQMNFMDEEYQAGIEGMRYAREKGMGIVIMEPLRGGTLVNNIPDDVQAVWDSAHNGKSVAQWGFDYLWDMEEVDVVLSGMSNEEQLRENIKSASNSEANSLTDYEKECISKVREIYRSRMNVNCTSCKYCMPCPAGVNIPSCFTYYNNSSMYQNVDWAKHQYHVFIDPSKMASNCVGCGKCEKVCPQHIQIRGAMKDIVRLFED